MMKTHRIRSTHSQITSSGRGSGYTGSLVMPDADEQKPRSESSRRTKSIIWNAPTEVVHLLG
jgi:hypothetical protein